ncbi:MAG: acetolactate synthase large subunit [Acidimicrobiia bacterium]|nr:acetolactate synthase large subunit [Acidimicrobiia bacterium]
MSDPTAPNGAQALVQTLVDAGVDVCFTNPGTSEMHFVAALDDVTAMRGVLALFEGAVTGAADGYARMADRPAATLLHLGPGLGNGLANLHNARRAHTPIVNIVGDHATYHKQYDAPLESDIDAIAGAVSGWFRRSMTPDAVAADTADAVAAARTPPGQVATLVLPADVCWLPAPAGPAPAVAPPAGRPPASDQVAAAAKALQSGEPCTVLIGGRSMRADGIRTAARIGHATGAKVMAETFPSRHERGAGLPDIPRLAYLAEFAQMQLDGTRHLILVDTVEPVSFFAYPDKASVLTPDGCQVSTLAAGPDDPLQALEALANEVGAVDAAPTAPTGRPDRPTGPLDTETLAAAIGATLPDGAIVVDEANTSGLSIPGATAGGPHHDWLCLTGGAIGIGLPLALGAAVACPDRRVLALEADGSAMYTLQALWSMAREQLDVTTVIANNSSYAVLNMELNRVGADAGGPRSRSMLDLRDPDLDFVALAGGMGVDGVRVESAEDLTTQLERCNGEPGPHLIEAVVPALGL